MVMQAQDITARAANRLKTVAAPAQATLATPGQDADMKALLEGQMIPVLETLLGHAVQAYTQGPDRADFTVVDPDGTEYFNAEGYSSALKDSLDAVTKIATQLNQARKLGTGTIELGDGTLITSEMLNSSDPAVAAQARAEFENRSREVFNGYNKLMNETGLAQYEVDLNAATFENDRRAKEFNSAVDSVQAGLDWDKTNISRTADVINRELSGMQESRARADLATEALLKAAPWATTPGKTSFTGEDFGGGVSALVRQAGGNPGVPLINFPTTVNIDPAALMAQGDAALGVGQGPLPGVPELTTPRGAVPLAPSYMPGPAAPALNMPVPLATAADEMRKREAQKAAVSLIAGRFRGLIP